MDQNDSGHILKVVLSGKHLSDLEIKNIENDLPKYKLNDYSLVVYQSVSSLQDHELLNFGEKFKVDILADLYEKNEEKLRSKEDEIELLKNELTRIKLNNIAAEKLASLVQSQFDIEQIAIDNLVYINSNSLDTVPTVLVRWSDKVDDKSRRQQHEKMQKLLKIELEREDVFLFDLN